MKGFGKLLAVAAGFVVYYLAVGIIIICIVYSLLSYVQHGLKAALLIAVRFLFPIGISIGFIFLFSRVIKRSR